MTMIGGFAAAGCGPVPIPARAELQWTGTAWLWTVGLEGALLPLRTAASDRRQVAVIGICGAADGELEALAACGVVPQDLRRWSGAYAVVEATEGRLSLFADLASAVPLYWARAADGIAWSTSARALASLVGGGIDLGFLAGRLLMPGTSAVLTSRSAFDGVAAVPAGDRLDLRPGTVPRPVPAWRPAARRGLDAARGFAEALTSSVTARLDHGPDPVTCDLSGGLDSTALARIAGEAQAARGAKISAVTLHPAGVFHGGDLDYALAAAGHPGIDHHLLARDDRHLPYTGLTALPAVDEPAPGTVAVVFWLRHLRYAGDRLGSRIHLTGDGGDTLLCPPLMYLADLLRARRLRRCVADAVGWSSVYRMSAAPLLIGSACAARTTRAGALARLADAAARPSRAAASAIVGWYAPPLDVPWATGALRQLTAQAVAAAADLAAAEPEPADAGSHLAWENITEIGRTAAADAHLAHAATGVVQHNPFADSAVVAAALSSPAADRADPHRFKPLLHAALPGLLPPGLAARTTKGDSTADHVRGLRANLAGLQALTAGHLAGYGLLEPDALNALLGQAAAGVPAAAQLIQPAIAAEIWLRSLDEAAPIVWTTTRLHDPTAVAS